MKPPSRDTALSMTIRMPTIRTFRTLRMLLLACGVGPSIASRAVSQSVSGPDTVVIPSGALHLRGLLWRPTGPGSFPGILVMHGSGGRVFTGDAAQLGGSFARRGYAVLFV